MSEDWLDIGGEGTASLPAVVALPESYAERAALVEACWSRLTLGQKTFLQAWRDCRFNARAACKRVGLSENTRPNTLWMQKPDYATVARVWQANAAADALDRDRLLARQDDIVETLLTPKPILHQGVPTGFEEVEAGAASRANETLMKAAGLLKDKEVEVNVGVVVGGPPTLNIQVLPKPPSQAVKRDSVVIDAKFTEIPEEVSATAPGSLQPGDSVATPAQDTDEWLST